MKQLITTFALACMALASHAKPVAFNAPDFEVRIELTEKAQSYLTTHKETMNVSITYADFIGVGGNVFGEFNRTYKGPAVIQMRDLQFSQKKLKTLTIADYEIHIGIGSGHQSSQWNVLDCEFLQDNISKLQHKNQTLRCDLIDEKRQR